LDKFAIRLRVEAKRSNTYLRLSSVVQTVKIACLARSVALR
jgi:hypothetical protein